MRSPERGSMKIHCSPLTILLMLTSVFLGLWVSADCAEAQSRGSGTSTSPQVRPQSRPQSRPQVRPQTRPQTRPQVRPQSRPQVRPQTRPQVRPQTGRPTTISRPGTQLRPPVSTPGPISIPAPVVNPPRVSPPSRGTSTRGSGLSGRSTTVTPGSNLGERNQPGIRPRKQPSITLPGANGVSTRTGVRARQIRKKPVSVPNALPVSPLPALKPTSDQSVGGVSTTLGGAGSSTLNKPPTRDMIQRLGRGGDRGVDLSNRTRARTLSQRNPRVQLSPSGAIHTGVGTIRPPVSASGVYTSTSLHTHQLPWYCHPIYSHGVYTNVGISLGSGVYGWYSPLCSPWYFGYPQTWCYGWWLPWSCSSTHFIYWWHHGYWSSYSQGVRWSSTVYCDSEIRNHIVFVETEEAEEEQISSAEVQRSAICDAWSAMLLSEEEEALAHLERAKIGHPDVALVHFLEGVNRLRLGDLPGAGASWSDAIAIEPELMSLRWDAVLYLERRTEAVLEELWALIEEDSQQPDVVTVVACLSLFAGDIALAPARGALSELLLAGEGDEVTVQLHQVLRGDRVAFPSESSAWLEKPSCSALLNVSF